MNKAIFLDRDGVLNMDRPDYVYETGQFKLLEGVYEGLKKFKDAGYKLIVITNQSGIAKKIYTHNHVKVIHDLLQEQCKNVIDDFYYAPWHPSISESLSRKPGTLMFERAIAKYDIDPKSSWMLGDRERDLVPAKKLGIKTVIIGEERTPVADMNAENVNVAAEMIIEKIK